MAVFPHRYMNTGDVGPDDKFRWSVTNGQTDSGHSVFYECVSNTFRSINEYPVVVLCFFFFLVESR